MTTPTEMLFSDAREALLREFLSTSGQVSSNDAFTAWLLPGYVFSADLRSLASAAATRLQAERNYQHIAAIGFAAHAGAVAEKEREVLAVGIQWLVGRKPLVDGNLMAFCTDAVALLGIALGTKALGNQCTETAVADWMTQFLPGCYQMPAIQDWQRCLFAVAQREAHTEPALAIPDAASVADVRVALRAKGFLAISDRSVVEHDEGEALALLKTEHAQGLGQVRAALRVTAFDWIQRCAPVTIPRRATVQDVYDLLRGVSAGLRRWTWEDRPRTRRAGAQPRKWHVDNEYHVQNLLYFLLFPIFPDLKDEEYFPSLGQKQPRTDLFIPSLKLIIEVKFVYPTTSFQDIIGQIGEDTSLYLAGHADYTGIIAFVWDDTRRTEEHGLLVRGLTRIAGIIDAVVVSRPGGMQDSLKPHA